MRDQKLPKVKKEHAVEQHSRVNRILLGPLERPALKWLAEHMPPWMTPDILTGIGFLGAVLIAVSYYLTNYNPAFLWLASFGFVVNWFGDSLDGTLARFRHIERPRYGFFLDHTLDSASETIIFIGLGLSPYVNLDLAFLALIGYLLLSIFVFISTYVSGEFKISYGRFGPTEIRAVAILANTLIFFMGNPVVEILNLNIQLYDLLLGFITLVLYSIFIVSTILRAQQLNEMEKRDQG
jgi:phosphatidylglycerophosphate synthase